MKFLVDECVATEVAKAAHDLGYQAAHVAYVGLTGTADHTLARLAIDESWIIVTRNAKDFRGRKPPSPGGVLGREEIHPGLVCLNLPAATAEEQVSAFQAALAELESIGSTINVVVEVNDGPSWEVLRYTMPPLSG
jgi:predicted nuclease of predicted toxin-antitoxin system